MKTLDIVGLGAIKTGDETAEAQIRALWGTPGAS
jgi:hypothetical protein